MGRVINTNSPTKQRNSQRRLIAEMLQRMGQKGAIDGETKDMAAMMVFALRELYATAEIAATAWEKKGYWLKAERFVRDWEWTKPTAANIEDVVREEAWELLPQLLMEMMPRFNDLQIKSFTHPPTTWANAHQKLLAEKPDVLI
jgi:hypothetical protein